MIPVPATSVCAFTVPVVPASPLGPSKYFDVQDTYLLFLSGMPYFLLLREELFSRFYVPSIIYRFYPDPKHKLLFKDIKIYIYISFLKVAIHLQMSVTKSADILNKHRIYDCVIDPLPKLAIHFGRRYPLFEPEL